MCGRFTLTLSIDELIEEFELPDHITEERNPRYNIAPTQSILAIRVDAENQQRNMHPLHWGLIPSWSKDPSIGSRMINARAETLSEKPSFRSAFRSRRCLIPTDGFYEWKKTGSKKQPFYIRMKDESVFAFAGLWEHFNGPDGTIIDSCTIITTEPNALMADLHHRMPVILSRDQYDDWLNPANNNTTELQPLLQSYVAEKMQAYPVSPWVNRATNDDIQCVKQLDH